MYLDSITLRSMSMNKCTVSSGLLSLLGNFQNVMLRGPPQVSGSVRSAARTGTCGTATALTTTYLILPPIVSLPLAYARCIHTYKQPVSTVYKLNSYMYIQYSSCEYEILGKSSGSSHKPRHRLFTRVRLEVPWTSHFLTFADTVSTLYVAYPLTETATIDECSLDFFYC